MKDEVRLALPQNHMGEQALQSKVQHLEDQLHQELERSHSHLVQNSSTPETPGGKDGLAQDPWGAEVGRRLLKAPSSRVMAAGLVTITLCEE